MKNPNEENKIKVIKSHRSELNHQTFLELAINYFNKGLNDEGIKLLELGSKHLINNIWLTYLKKDEDQLNRIIDVIKSNY